MYFFLNIKKHVASLLYYSKLCNFFEKIKKNRAFILTYHRIVKPSQTYKYYLQPGMYVTDKKFKMQMKFLKSNYDVLPLEKLIWMKEKCKDLTGCCSITFDDGWRDNYENAYPIIKDLNLPVTIFLATGYIDTNKWFWPEEVTYNLLTRNIEEVMERLPKDLKQILLNYDLSKETTREKIIELIKTYEINVRQRLVSCLKNEPVERKERLLLNWKEILEMGKSNLVFFGSHTVNHEILDKLSEDEIYLEIEKSKEIIESNLGRKVNLFAYPNGNYNENIINILNSLKFNGAVITQKGYMDNGTSLMKIPRISIHEDISSSIPQFICRILFSFF